MFMRYACLTGNRGLLFEVGYAAEGLDLTEATPGYMRQIVPNASSPLGFWSKEGQPFRYVVGKVGVHIKSIFISPGETRRQRSKQLDFHGKIYNINQYNNRVRLLFSTDVGHARVLEAFYKCILNFDQ